MKEIAETHLSGRGYDIRLPRLGADLPDRFYSRMAEEIVSVVSGDVRRYVASFTYYERGGVLHVDVELRARILTRGGAVLRKKTLHQAWRGGFLLSFSEDKG